MKIVRISMMIDKKEDGLLLHHHGILVSNIVCDQTHIPADANEFIVCGIYLDRIEDPLYFAVLLNYTH